VEILLFQHRITSLLELGISKGLITYDEYRFLINLLERERRVATAHPELYLGLLEDSMNLIPKLAREAGRELTILNEELKKRGLQVKKVERDESFWSFRALGSDASSCPVPMEMLRAAVVSGVAEIEGSKPIVLRDFVTAKSGEMGEGAFKFYYKLRAEALIPVACLRLLEECEKGKLAPPDCIVIDGPLSASRLLFRVPKRYRGTTDKRALEELEERARQLIKLREELMRRCRELKIPLFSIVKRCATRYFMKWFGLREKTPYMDQYIFHQILQYGERTSSISITKAIGIRERVPRLTEVHAFYIKTSKNPLTPPIRVEYPDYLRSREDWIASYVLSTSLTTREAEFDGIPKALCLAHRDCRITKRIVKEIYRRVIFNLLNQGLDAKLMSPTWGTSFD
jgi:hypothetical protein